MTKKRKLTTLSDVRRLLASLINRAESGEIDINFASKLGYLANSLARVIESNETQKRLEHNDINGYNPFQGIVFNVKFVTPEGEKRRELKQANVELVNENSEILSEADT